MSENVTQTKKFLDYEGVKYLWSKINMNDYPNNETLMDVIEAIDETKVDKIDDKGLSTNDFTNEYKEKLDGLENYATKSYVNEGLATKQPIGDYALKTDILSPDLSQNDPEAADYVKGVIRQESLPEGYPYKTKTTTDLITWDGNADGLVTIDVGGMLLYKISDNTLTEDELNGTIMRLSNGTDSIEMETVTMSAGGVVAFADSNDKYGGFIVYSDNYDLYGTVFPEAGIYWSNMASDGYYLTALSKVDLTINTISKDFLPTDFIVDIVPNETRDSYTANKTYDEIYKEVVSGRRVIARLYNSKHTFIGNAIEIPLVEMPGGNDDYPAVFCGVCENRYSIEDVVKIVINDSDSIRVTFGSLPTISTATHGQTIVVKDVDESGRPTEWEAVDLLTGADDAVVLAMELGLIESVYTADDGSIYTDKNGNIYTL